MGSLPNELNECNVTVNIDKCIETVTRNLIEI